MENKIFGGRRHWVVRTIFLFLFMITISQAVTISMSDEGTDVRTITTGQLLPSGSLIIRIYNQSAGGTLIYAKSYPNAIINGSWNVMIDNIDVEFNKQYWKDYEINGDDIDFDGQNRIGFFSPYGTIHATDLEPNINLTNATGYPETDPSWTANASRVTNLETSNTTTNSRIDTMNSTKLDASDQRYNDTVLANSKAGTGTCSAGNVVMNTTTSGVQCVAPLFSFIETDPSWAANESRVTNLENNKLDATDQRYNETSLIYCLGGTCNGNLQVNGNFTVIGSYINATVTQQDINGSFFPQLNNTFTLGNATNVWNAIYGFVDWPFIKNAPAFLTTETDPSWSANSSTVARTGNCAAGNVVMNTTTSGVQCVAPLFSFTETDPSWTANESRVTNLESSNTTTNSRIDTLNSTKLEASDQRYNDTVLANSKAAIGDCGAGEVVQNTTTSGVQCVVPPAGAEVDPSWSANSSTVARTGTCGAGQVVQNTTTSGVQCIAAGGAETDPVWTADKPSYNTTAQLNTLYAALLGIDASNITTGTFADARIASASAWNGKAGTGACSANQFGIATTTSALTCAQPSTDNLTEGTAKFYTDALARAALSNTAPITYNSGTGAIGISQATTSTDGYLSSTNWNTFNGKAGTGASTPSCAYGVATVSTTTGIPTTTCASQQGTVTSVGTTAPLSGTVTTSGSLSITQSTTSTDGYLSSTNWNTFNGKESALTFSTGLNRATNTITLKNPAAGEIGGVKSLTCTGSDKLSAIGTDGLPVCSTDTLSSTGNISTYTNTGVNTWTKPASGAWVSVQMWAGGGSGGAGGDTDAGGGGGGGGYVEFRLPIASFAASENCTVGAGGAGQATDDADGNVGGTTTMTVSGVTYSVYGGGGGNGNTAADGGGGGGGGAWGAGTVGTSATGGVGGIGCGAAGAGVAAGLWGDVCGGGGGTTAGGFASQGGGGGGLGENSGTSGAGGKTVNGGGGGGGGHGTGTGGAGGTSIYGGAGGAGSTGAAAGTDGTQPAGGGGGSETGTSGKGGDGKCVITVY